MSGTNTFGDQTYLRELESVVQRQRTDLESNEELIANLRSQVQELLDQLFISNGSVFILSLDLALFGLEECNVQIRVQIRVSTLMPFTSR